MTNTTPAPIRTGDAEALAQAEAMVARYEYRVSLHADTGPTTAQERVEAKNLAHWCRRLEAIQAKANSASEDRAQHSRAGNER